MTLLARPAWIKAWAVLAALVFIWAAAMLLTPDRCSILSHCPWTSDFGIGLLGAPVILVALLAALVLSAIAWWRRR